MGYDIEAISRADRVSGRHSDDVCEDEGHCLIGSCRKRLDGRKPGCYLKRGKSYGFCASYGGYDTWINDLSTIILGVSADEVGGQPRRFKQQPFFELITLPFANDVGIGPTTSAKLNQDFAKHAAKAKRGFQQIAREAQEQRKAGKKKLTKRSHPLAAVHAIAVALGGTVTGGADDSGASAWEWKWQLYREFRRAFKMASDDGFVVVSP